MGSGKSTKPDLENMPLTLDDTSLNRRLTTTRHSGQKKSA